MIDWRLLVNKLRTVKPVSRIAKEVGAKENHLNRIARGEVAEPRFNTGIRLLDYYYDNFPDDMGSVRL